MPSPNVKHRNKSYKDASSEDKAESPSTVVYSKDCEGLANDYEHGSIEMSGNCTIIKEAARVLSRLQCFVPLFGKY
jgi:hypothetical protein